MQLYDILKPFNDDDVNRILIALLNLNDMQIGDNKGSYVDLHDDHIVFTIKNSTEQIRESFRSHECYLYDYEDEWNPKLIYEVYDIPKKYRMLLNDKDPFELILNLTSDTTKFWCCKHA